MSFSPVHHHSSGTERLLRGIEDGSQGHGAFNHGENVKQPLPEADNQQREGHSRRLPNSSGTVAPLLQLPDEVLLSAMLFMPYNSLYMLRQTCHAFRNLVDDHVFEGFQSEILQNQGRSSCMTEYGFCQLRLIRNLLRRRTLCHSCGQMADSGELDRRLAEYWRRKFCQGCKKNHPGIFFSADVRDTSCLGRLGFFALGGIHKISGKILVSWEGYPRRRLASYKGSTAVPEYGRWVPALYLSESYNYTRAEGICLSHLMRLRTFHRTTISSLERSLRELHQNPSWGCKHLPSLIDSLLSTMTSNNCKCFPPSGIPAPGLTHLLNMRSAAKRRARLCRNHKLTCQTCRINYTVLRDGKDMLLQVDVLPFFVSPVSPAWLSRLSFEHDKNPILDESTEGVLWCRDPYCSTGSGKRWLRMLDIFRAPRTFRGNEAEYQRGDGLTKAEVQLSFELQSYQRYCSSRK
jgi:hypothetical protein